MTRHSTSEEEIKVTKLSRTRGACRRQCTGSLPAAKATPKTSPTPPRRLSFLLFKTESNLGTILSLSPSLVSRRHRLEHRKSLPLTFSFSNEQGGVAREARQRSAEIG